jgi:succinate dehydrogenase / fumarate reductase cytochrome b subunit
MAAIAPKLDIELVELDRANCCGAGVIAEHNQELVDTLNARTFAMAQRVEGAAGMMNICSTCQGAQSECQERLDADRGYREHINSNLAAEQLSYERDGKWWNKNLLWLLIEALGGESVQYAGARKCCGFPVITMSRTTSLRQAGRHLADAIDAGADCLVTPCPLCHLNLDMQQPDAQKYVERDDLGIPVLHLPQLLGLALGLEPKELGMNKHVVSTKPVQQKLAAAESLVASR